jgi:hypothetical protein
MTTQTTPIPVPRAIAALTDAIRAEVRAELIEKLSTQLESMLGAEDEAYLDGLRDAITLLAG